MQEGFPLLSNVSSKVFSHMQVGLVGSSGESAHFPALLHDTSLHGGGPVGDSEGVEDGISLGWSEGTSFELEFRVREVK